MNRNDGATVRIVVIASGDSAKMTGKCECPKNVTGKSVWRKTFRASISPKM